MMTTRSVANLSTHGGGLKNANNADTLLYCAWATRISHSTRHLGLQIVSPAPELIGRAGERAQPRALLVRALEEVQGNVWALV